MPSQMNAVDSLAEGLSVVNYCQPCSRLTLEESPTCSLCGSLLEAVSRIGAVYSYTLVAQSPDEDPAVLALVQLSDGPLLMAQIRDLTDENLQIGLPVELAPDSPCPETGRLVFSPLSSSSQSLS